MQIKENERPTMLPWVAGAVRRAFSGFTSRRWLIGGVTISASLLVFYAGATTKEGQLLARTVDRLFDLNATKVKDYVGTNARKYVKGQLASPRRLVIDIKQTDYQKLQFHREQAIKRWRIITTRDSFVPAKIIADGKSYRVKMRLKGDMTDHLLGEKWSFRIHVRGGDAIWGMKRFSIQDPSRSGWIKEWIMYAWFSFENLIALRYDFINVTINGRDMGIFAMEESFGKELVEHNERVEAPILKFDESLQINLKVVNRGNVDPRSSYTELWHLADIISFETSEMFQTEKLKNNFLVGRSLLHQLREGEKSLHEVFDVERAARIFAIADHIGIHHQLLWKNVRFYFNPVTTRLELIAYNAYTDSQELGHTKQLLYQRWLNHEVGLNTSYEWFSVFFSDEQFLEHYFNELNRLSSPGYLEGFFETIGDELEGKLSILYKDGPFDQVPVEKYLRNRDNIAALIHPTKVPVKVFLKASEPDRGNVLLTVANTAYLPTRIEALECLTTNSTATDPKPTLITGKRPRMPLPYMDVAFQGFGPQDRVCVEELNRSGDRQILAGLRLRYRILGQTKTHLAEIDAYPVEIAWELVRPEIERERRRLLDQAVILELKEWGALHIHSEAREIAIQPGEWKVTEDIVFPPGYRVTGGPDTALVLNEGAALISFSPLQLNGDSKAPFIVRSDDGRGQGIVVISAEGVSTLNHVTVSNQRAIERGAWRLTGGVTFYESEVHLLNSRFQNGHSEDLVNLIRSDFVIRDSYFAQSYSDALDADFGDGIIEDSSFLLCGNDCIDLSGSETVIRNVRIEGAGDKAISVGERSRVDIERGHVQNANIGVASKDSSIVQVKGLQIQDSAIGVAAYQKKPEFSGATVRATDLSLENTKVPYQVEAGSTVVSDGEAIATTQVP